MLDTGSLNAGILQGCTVIEFPFRDLPAFVVQLRHYSIKPTFYVPIQAAEPRFIKSQSDFITKHETQKTKH